MQRRDLRPLPQQGTPRRKEPASETLHLLDKHAYCGRIRDRVRYLDKDIETLRICMAAKALEPADTFTAIPILSRQC